MPDNWVIFTLAGERFAIPIDAVDLIASPPALCRIPHALPALLDGDRHLGAHRRACEEAPAVALRAELGAVQGEMLGA